MEHQQKFQAVAGANNNTRAAATVGYDASAEYVASRLRNAGYTVRLEPFDFPDWELTSSSFEQVSPTSKPYAEDTDYIVAQFSGAGDLTTRVVPTDDIVIPPGAAANTSTSGCEEDDFPADVSGNIALIQRGTCTFVQKINNAKAAGAAGVLIFNEGQAGRTDPLPISASPYIGIPVAFTSFAVGEELYAARSSTEPVVHLMVEATTRSRTQYNVIGDSRLGDPDRTVVIGAHLDSVEEGPGINDNGSGTSADLEIAEAIGELKLRPRNRLRFAFWGAEEAGLIGSTAYVNQLSGSERQDIFANLNFDMVGSPNFVRFVYDGDTSDTPPPPSGAPAGSGEIEDVFLDYFDSQDLETDPTAFDGRSDYGPFIAAGIPAGGLFTGAEGIKTPEQATVYGGTAGMAYDPCYHQACDTLANLSSTALDQMSDAAAHAAWTLARTKSGFEAASSAKAKKAKRAKAGRRSGRLSRFPYRGRFRQR